MKIPDIKDETLLGYALDALSVEEHRQVTEALAQFPEIAERYRKLRELLLPLESSPEYYEPPATLVEKSLEAVFDPVSTGLSPEKRVVGANISTSWLDFGFATAASVIGLCLVFPSVLTSRELARQNSCANRLHWISDALSSFADQNALRKIPNVELEGKMSFAGSYAVKLNDTGLISSHEIVWCPSVTCDRSIVTSIPSQIEIENAEPVRLEYLRKVAGGSYAYNLGFQDEGRYDTPRLTGRSSFVIMADSPVLQSNSKEMWLVHGGRGLNLLFEDGHVQFVRLAADVEFVDHPFFNRIGRREAGVDRFDSSLGPSYLRPLGARGIKTSVIDRE